MARPIRTLALVVTRVDDPAPGIRRFVLEDEDGWPLPPFEPGAHVDVHLPCGLVRTYSLCNPPADCRRYVIAVKREDAGRGGSRHMHEVLRPGDRIGVSLPRGAVPAHCSAMNIFIAGGIGITPFISAVRDLESAGRSNYVVHWASRGRPPLIDMLQDAQAAGRVRLYDTLVEPAPVLAAIIGSAAEGARAFCCGPPGMLDAFERAVAHWPDDRKHVERFLAPKAAPAAGGAPYTVVLARSRKEARVDPGAGLLRALESLDAGVSVSCEGGICGACSTPWLEGPPVHRDRVLSPQQREKQVMVCVAGCAGPRLVLDI
jgi:vanillate O-demethylase ferredoxin subunit